ncbi:MAG: phosphohistidine phosphatase SixA [Verrucomicrobiia bacterium]
MKLFLMRHSDATGGADDNLRSLSEKGVEQSRKIGNFLKNVGIVFDAAFSSPLLRAKQTAEIVVSFTNKEPLNVVVTDALLNEASQKEFSRFLNDLLAYENVLLVGHSPSIEARLSFLLGIASPDSIKFAKAAVACIETSDGMTGSLLFFVNPKIL